MKISQTGVSAASTTTLDDVAKKFSLKNLSPAGRHHLRLKAGKDGQDGVLFTTPFMDVTKFKALVLRDNDAKQKIADERQAAIEWLGGKLTKEYGQGVANAIKLPGKTSLRAHHTGTMLGHAAASAAMQQMRMHGEKKLTPGLEEALFKGAVEHVNQMGLNATAQDRIHAAKVYLLKEYAQTLLKANVGFDTASKTLDIIFDQRMAPPKSLLSIDVDVAIGIAKLLNKGAEVSVVALDEIVMQIRGNIEQ
jgi:hypothetical protein